MRQLSLLPQDLWLQNGRLAGPLPPEAPMIVSNGVGVDSVALLVELHRLNVVPDAIVTALVGQGAYGNEHPRFYTYLPVLEAWLAEIGFPPIQYVWYEMKRPAKYFPYWSLAGNCLPNRTLPSISFRRHHSCSLKFKGAEIDRWVTRQYGERPLRQARCRLCYWLIGYDLSEGARAYDCFVYPLQQFGLDCSGCETVMAGTAVFPLPAWGIVDFDGDGQGNAV